MAQPPRIKLHQGSWYVFYAENGRSQRTSLRTKDKEIAERRFAGWLEQRELEMSVQEDPTIDFVLDVWFDQWVRDRFLSANRYPSIIKHLKAHFGHMRVSRVQREHSVSYAKKRRKVASESTICTELNKLRAALNFMLYRIEPNERRLDHKIIPYIEIPPTGPPRDRVITREELQLLWDYCLQDKNRQTLENSNRISREARFLILAMETAQRKGAIKELTWSQVDFDRRLIMFNPVGRNQTTKRRPPIPMSRKLEQQLLIMHEQKINNYVLDVKTDIHYGVKRILEDLGIENASPHTFRHTWATHAAEDGVPMHTIAAFLGDTERTVRKNYLHLSPDYLRMAVDREPTAQIAPLPS
jgi:integrase